MGKRKRFVLLGLAGLLALTSCGSESNDEVIRESLEDAAL